MIKFRILKNFSKKELAFSLHILKNFLILIFKKIEFFMCSLSTFIILKKKSKKYALCANFLLFLRIQIYLLRLTFSYSST